MTKREQINAALDIVEALVLEDGRPWGDAAHPWQRADVEAILNGAILLHFITRPRGGSKTSDLAAVVIAFLLMLMPPRGRGYGFAADRDQAKLLVDAIAGFVARTPGLADTLEVQELRVTNTVTGARFEAQAADAASAHGKIAQLIVADEVSQWPQTTNSSELWEAVVSTVPKVEDGRLVCLTTAGAPTHWSYEVITKARIDEYWRVAELPGPVPWLRESSLRAQRALLSESAYARLHLNVWTDLEDVSITRDKVLACRRETGTLEPGRDVHYVHGVDLSMTSDYTVVATCHLEHRGEEPVVVVDRLRTWKPSRAQPIDQAEVTAYVGEVARRYPSVVIMDPYQAASMGQALRRQGVAARDTEMSAAANNRRAIALHALLKDARLSIPADDDDLVAELSALIFRETSPSVYKLDNARAGQGHHDRATAISLAALELLARGSGPRLVTFDDLEPDRDPLNSPDDLLEQHGPIAPPGAAFMIGGQPADLDSPAIGGQPNPFAPTGADPAPDEGGQGMRSPYMPGGAA